MFFSFSFVCKFPYIPTVRSLLAWQSCLHGMSSFTFGVLYMTLHVQFTPFQLILLEHFCCLSLFFVCKFKDRGSFIALSFYNSSFALRL